MIYKKKEKIKVYLYTRVSTTMQIDGYSFYAQKTKMKAFCDYNEYEIAGEYEDAGKSGKSIEGRVSFNQIWILLIMKISIISEEKRRKTDSENHLYMTYDKIDEVEELLV